MNPIKHLFSFLLLSFFAITVNAQVTYDYPTIRVGYQEPMNSGSIIIQSNRQTNSRSLFPNSVRKKLKARKDCGQQAFDIKTCENIDDILGYYFEWPEAMELRGIFLSRKIEKNRLKGLYLPKDTITEEVYKWIESAQDIKIYFHFKTQDSIFFNSKIIKVKGSYLLNHYWQDPSYLAEFKAHPKLDKELVERTYLKVLRGDQPPLELSFKGCRYDLNRIPCDATGLYFEFDRRLPGGDVMEDRPFIIVDY